MTPYIRSACFTVCILGGAILSWAHPRMDCSVRSVAPSEAEVSRQIQQEQEQRKLDADAKAIEQVFRENLETCGNSNADGLLGIHQVSYSAAKYAEKNGLKPRLVAATITVESGCHAGAVSRAGAVGLMQIDCTHTWRQYSRKELENPDRNVQVGTLILARYIRQTGNTRDGLRYYFGVTPGSTASDEYADKVLERARRKK